MFRTTGGWPGADGVSTGSSLICVPPPFSAIGQIQSVTGIVTATRAAGPVALKAGDLVYRGDVIETAPDGAVGIVFIDGTAFNLSDSARLALDEFLCDPKGRLHSSLVQSRPWRLCIHCRPASTRRGAAH